MSEDGAWALDKHYIALFFLIELKMAIQIPSNASNSKPYFVLVPLMAQGHMIPMIDMARLLATHGAIVTLITTPVNASRISTIITHVEQSNLPIKFVQLHFLATEVGLPEGLENIDMLPSRDLMKNFFDAICKMRDPLITHLRSNRPLPNCIISDNIHYWAHAVAREFYIPRLVFHGFGCFSLLGLRNIWDRRINEEVKDENEPFVVPGLPTTIEVTRAQVPGFLVMSNLDTHREVVREIELASDGMVLNGFDDLETLYRESYENTTGKKVLTIGPLLFSNRDVEDTVARGNKASLDVDQCLSWLDSMKPCSVIYVSFDSLACTIPLQLIELGLGLEASNRTFIWMIKVGERFPEVEEWLSKFEERTRDKGLMIRGWAPQLMILSHTTVGGFLTHSGWNSTLESVSVGVPMITWPHFAEQFFNEKLVVKVLRIGIAVGVKSPIIWGVENSDVLMKKDDVENAIRSLFDKGKEGKERRKRAKEFGEKAHWPIERGGSSYRNLTQLIQDMNLSNCT